MCVLGAVLEVQEFELILSLPFNMRGSVAISDVSDQLSQRLSLEADQLEQSDQKQVSVCMCVYIGCPLGRAVQYNSLNSKHSIWLQELY